MNDLTVSSLQLPIHVTKVMYYRVNWDETEAPVAPHALAANHSMVASRFSNSALRTFMLDGTRRLYLQGWHVQVFAWAGL